MNDRRTWDGRRWCFVLIATFFAGLTAYLATQMDGRAMFLLAIPVLFALLALAAALFATDEGLRKLTDVLLIFNP